MDGPKPEKPADVPAAEPEAKKPARRFFMDVRHPKAEAAKPAEAAVEKPASSPVDTPQPEQAAKPVESKSEEAMAVAPEEVNDPVQQLDEPKKGKEPKAPKPPKPPKQPHAPGVGLAIFATVVIILGLAALATYAYLQTNNASPF